MGVPQALQAHVGAYVLGQKLKGRHRFSLVLMLEPLFCCNLACAGCGKPEIPLCDQRSSARDQGGAAAQ